MIGGSNDNEGRVEVCVLGQWGTVCDDGWSQQNAKVACNQLGIEGGKTFKIIRGVYISRVYLKSMSSFSEVYSYIIYN